MIVKKRASMLDLVSAPIKKEHFVELSKTKPKANEEINKSLSTGIKMPMNAISGQKSEDSGDQTLNLGSHIVSLKDLMDKGAASTVLERFSKAYQGTNKSADPKLKYMESGYERSAPF